MKLLLKLTKRVATVRILNAWKTIVFVTNQVEYAPKNVNVLIAKIQKSLHSIWKTTRLLWSSNLILNLKDAIVRQNVWKNIVFVILMVENVQNYVNAKIVTTLRIRKTMILKKRKELDWISLLEKKSKLVSLTVN